MTMMGIIMKVIVMKVIIITTQTIIMLGTNIITATIMNTIMMDMNTQNT